MNSAESELRFRTWAVTAVVVLANCLGNFFLSWGLKQRASAVFSPREYLEVLFSPWVTLGVLLLILWALSRMTLLSWADLSFVLPVTAVGYVLAAVSGKLFLGERVSGQRWLGTLLIMAGTMLVGSTSVRTRQEDAGGGR